jgi:hypothetical protein
LNLNFTSEGHGKVAGCGSLGGLIPRFLQEYWQNHACQLVLCQGKQLPANIFGTFRVLLNDSLQLSSPQSL